jgi:hypothetical protein
MVIEDIKVPQTREGRLERLNEHTLIIARNWNAVKVYYEPHGYELTENGFIPDELHTAVQIIESFKGDK